MQIAKKVLDFDGSEPFFFYKPLSEVSYLSRTNLKLN